MKWYLLQASIIFAVVASNIHWHWTPSGYLPAMLGSWLAWLLTRLLSVRWRVRFLRGAGVRAAPENEL
jgi:hypothetical protein